MNHRVNLDLIKQIVAPVAIVALLLSLSGLSVAAITNGELDGDGHPNVGTVFGITAICSGTLIAPKVFLTAAHCTQYFEDHGEPMWVTFNSAPDVDPDLTHPFFFTDDAVRGTAHAHPDFTGPFGVGDIAVVVLDKAVRGVAPARLPELGRLDELTRKRGVDSTRFTTVGYGAVDSSHAGGVAHDIYEFDRSVATTRLADFLDPDDFAAKCRDTASCELLALTFAPGTGGGICHGDSGGPLFLGDSDTIVALTTGVRRADTCISEWYAYRTDTPTARSFLGDYVDLP